MTGPDADVILFPVRELPPRRQPDLPEPPDAPRSYRVRVDLDDVAPAIWRRLDLASDLTLAELHEILQTAMGWTDSHLHQFAVDGGRESDVAPFLTDFDVEEGDEGIHERDVRLDQVLERPGDTVTYLYDFGDGWEHTLTLEAVHDKTPTAVRARVVGGQRACPPEDCGGAPGYEELLMALADGPTDRDQRDLLAWLGPFDPEGFSAEETDRHLGLTLLTLGGAGGIRTTLRETGHDLSDVLSDLVERSWREPKPLATLLAAAELTRLDEPDPDVRAQMLRPWTRFLALIDAGVTLTAAGWLPPALVTDLATDLDLVEPWMGKANREQHFPPVRIIRESATDLGLVRKWKGALVPTTLGLRLAVDVDALWRHVAESLPVGRKPFERHAGTIMLMAVAAGESAYDGILRHGSSILWSAGWADSAGGAPGDAALDFARPTWEVLRVMGCDAGLRLRERPSEEIRQLARASLRTVGAPDVGTAH